MIRRPPRSTLFPYTTLFRSGTPLAVAAREAKRRIGYLAENNPLYGEMLVADYLAFIADLRELAGASRARSLDEAVTATGIEGVFYRPIGELSKGYRQRVGLAQAILHRPDLLVLDEPPYGLDPTDRGPEICALAKARGWTLYELHQETGSLEELFRQLTAGGDA